MSTPNKRNKREDKRRQVRYLLRHQLTSNSQDEGVTANEKEPLPENQAAEYFQYIKTNNVSKFGIVKLHRFQLDATYSAREVLKEEDWTGEGTGPFLPPSLTLMMYACYLKHGDKIMAALIRCGADPSVYPGVHPSHHPSSFALRSALTVFPPSYCVWLIRKLYGMAEVAILAASKTTFANDSSIGNKRIPFESTNDGHMTSVTDTKRRCATCSHISYSRNESRVQSDDLAPPSPLLLAWDCGHLLCWECSWRAACRPLRSTGHALRCPVQTCLQRCDGGDDHFFVTLSSLSPSSSALLLNGTEHGELKCGNEDTVMEHEKELRDKRKKESYLKWALLPAALSAYASVDAQDTTKNPTSHLPLPSCPKKPVLKAQPFYVITGQFLGTIRPQRVLELLKASAHGDTYRLHALLEAGVDLEGVNEYGQTALFVACMHCQVESVRYLLWAGADVSVTDNSRCGIAQALSFTASSSGLDQQSIIAMLKAHDCADDETEIRIKLPNLSLLPLPSAESHSSNGRNSSGRSSRGFESNINCGIFEGNNSNSVCNSTSSNSSFINPILTTLIPMDSDHPGAGACYIDSCFTEDFLTWLEKQYHHCPAAAPSKPSCSRRSYYCDTEGGLREAFAAALKGARAVLQSQLQSQCTGQGAEKSLKAFAVTTSTPAGPECNAPTPVPSSLGHAVHAVHEVFAFMRFLCYDSQGGWLPPHEDLSRSETSYCHGISDSTGEWNNVSIIGKRIPVTITSTHTFILYLTTCAEGGETNLLSSLHGGGGGREERGDKDENSTSAGDSGRREDCGVLASVKPVRGRLLLFPHRCPHEGAPAISLPKILLRGEAFGRGSVSI